MKRAVLTLVVCILGVSCVGQIAPLAPGAKACSNDWECPSDMHCGFPHVDTYAQCLRGAPKGR